MTRTASRTIAAVAGVAIAIGVWFGYAHRIAIKERLFDRKPPVPVAVNRDEVVPTTNSNVSVVTNNNANTTPAALPRSFNLNVPFTTQAPKVVWDEEHEEFCEEASVLMVARYWQDRPIKDTDDAEEALQQLKTWELDTFGYYKDTTAIEIARTLREFYGFGDVVVLTDPTGDDLRHEVAKGYPVIIPAAGRELGNPNFKSPGPLYHALVVKGYGADGTFVTNDPGTRKGADYVYGEAVLMAAIHDWNGGKVSEGARVAIVVRGK